MRVFETVLTPSANETLPVLIGPENKVLAFVTDDDSTSFSANLEVHVGGEADWADMTDVAATKVEIIRPRNNMRKSLPEQASVRVVASGTFVTVTVKIIVGDLPNDRVI